MRTVVAGTLLLPLAQNLLNATCQQATCRAGLNSDQVFSERSNDRRQQAALAAAAAALLTLSSPQFASAASASDARQTSGQVTLNKLCACMSHDQACKGYCCFQGDALAELLNRNAGSSMQGLGPGARQQFKASRCIYLSTKSWCGQCEIMHVIRPCKPCCLAQDLGVQRLVSDAGNQASTLANDAGNAADTTVDKVSFWSVISQV